ncbi:DUF7344 domain-containing protein [Halovivax cerinus]|uniref:DUF7344 domain-containing protein n=1 Tax=Halovivax cerinus TaxID=1487865 RepID=A0ABD5NL11_9EURY|nr:hypothetical protein [Halovivax cerinus]
MIPQTSDPNRLDDENQEIPPERLFRAFANDRRQRVVAYLAGKTAAIPIGDLAEYVAITEGQPTQERYERVLTALAHNHLPHLQDAGLVRYDALAETVECTASRSVIDPYLDLAGHAVE